MRICITGGTGFLGWHTACRLRTLHGVEAVRLSRDDVESPRRLAAAVAAADVVLHLAGVNRAETPGEVEEGNARIAAQLAAAVSQTGRPVDVVYANSVQADLDVPYGRGKARAADILATAVHSSGGAFADLLLPNLFGEHGRAHYNSFVATLVAEVARGAHPVVDQDREVSLLHVQAAAAEIIDAIGQDGRRLVPGEPRLLSDVLRRLQETHALYASRGEVPPLTTAFEVELFNTYRAASFPQMWPLLPSVNADERGELYEAVRAHGGTGQTFVSTTRPGRLRGDHYHLRKVERFMVLSGVAEIRLRRLLHDEVVSFRVSGTTPSFIDMPTLWVHNIRNVGESELVTMFWTDQLLDPHEPDQYPEKVDAS